MSLVPQLQQIVGDDLRAVAAYEAESCEIVYERADVAEKPTVIDKIHQELILEGMGTEYLEETFQVGKLNCTMHSFEEAMCFHFVRSSLRGVFVSIDPSSLIEVSQFVETCKRESAETEI